MISSSESFLEAGFSVLEAEDPAVLTADVGVVCDAGLVKEQKGGLAVKADPGASAVFHCS
jgi:hypothetical protein